MQERNCTWNTTGRARRTGRAVLRIDALTWTIGTKESNRTACRILDSARRASDEARRRVQETRESGNLTRSRSASLANQRRLANATAVPSEESDSAPARATTPPGGSDAITRRGLRRA